MLVVGGRLSEMAEPELQPFSRSPLQASRLVHVHPDSSELGRVYSPFMAINASPGAFAAALESLQAAGGSALGGGYPRGA